MTTNLLPIVKKIAEKRAKLEGFKTERAAMLLAVTETPKFKALESAIRNLSAGIERTEADLKKIAKEENQTIPEIQSGE